MAARALDVTSIILAPAFPFATSILTASNPILTAILVCISSWFGRTRNKAQSADVSFPISKTGQAMH